MTDDPIQDEYKDMMRSLAAAIDDMFNKAGEPKKVAFLVLMAKFGDIDGGRVNYISNANRDDMLKMMAEYLGRQRSS